MSNPNDNRISLQENEPHPRPMPVVGNGGISSALQSLQVPYQYLGNELQNITGSINYKSGVIVNTVPLLFIKLNLMPGEIAPIIANSLDIKFILRYVVVSNRPFGICHKINENMCTYGTLAAICDHSKVKEATTPETYEIKVKGLQLFQLLHVKSFPDSDNETLALARIKFIQNITIKQHPFNELCLRPKKYNLSRGEMFRKKVMWQSQWPAWVYNQFDVDELVSRIIKKVKILYKDVKFSNIPSILSFQVTKLGLFTHEEVNELLGIESTNLRLQFELQYLKKNQSMQKLKCTGFSCGLPISNMSYLLPISSRGLEDSYCDSWGVYNDMVTLTDVEDGLNLITVGNLSSRFFWFSGYKSSVIFCPNCTNYLGWKFVINEKSSLMPELFYGLSSHAITSIDSYILPLASPNDEMPLEENSDREIIFESVNDGGILVRF